ncbi:MAG: tRNA uridine-5-carboxymethylaminomethyl(34) synthesis GTPase MnmE [Xanthobacteraceae bacterium]
MTTDRSTIFALSSGRPPAAIAVMRLSGSNASVALEKLTGRLPEPRRAALVRVRDPASGEEIDEALALWFPAPHSETGEDVAELQLHGGHAVVGAVLEVLGRIDGCRLAEPGEFTRRAFENGRMDLTAVEGLADLIAAETPAQRRQAFRQLKGLTGGRAEAWRQRLIEALALIEARIDFSDEADVPEDLIGPAVHAAQQLRSEIVAALDGARHGERLREGLVVAIAGPPNAGKSTLLNRLARREAAIVSPYAGTTRDVIEVHLNLGGYPLTLLDTAGIRDSVEPIEQEGVRRARERAAAADLVLWVIDASGVDRDEPAQIKPPFDGEAVWLVRNKIDMVAGGESGTASGNNELEFNINVSASNGVGIDSLMNSLLDYSREFFSGAEAAIVTRARHRAMLEMTAAALDGALAEAQKSDPREELVAEELRAAGTALGRLTGRIDVEDVLDALFRDFCIGK